MSEQVFPAKVVKQRKEHTCAVCQTVMPVGETVKSFAGIMDGKFASWYEHSTKEDCDAALAKKGFA